MRRPTTTESETHVVLFTAGFFGRGFDSRRLHQTSNRSLLLPTARRSSPWPANNGRQPRPTPTDSTPPYLRPSDERSAPLNYRPGRSGAWCPESALHPRSAKNGPQPRPTPTDSTPPYLRPSDERSAPLNYRPGRSGAWCPESALHPAPQPEPTPAQPARGWRHDVRQPPSRYPPASGSPPDVHRRSAAGCAGNRPVRRWNWTATHL